MLFAAASPTANPGAYCGPGNLGELRRAPRPLIMPKARHAARAAGLWDVPEKLAATSFN